MLQRPRMELPTARPGLDSAIHDLAAIVRMLAATPRTDLWDRLQHAFGMERVDPLEVRLGGIEGH